MGKINFDVWVGSTFVEWKGLPGSDPDTEDVGVTPEDVLSAGGYVLTPEGYVGPDDDDDDDEELAVTPPEVIAALGFDPIDLFDNPWVKFKKGLNRMRVKTFGLIRGCFHS